MGHSQEAGAGMEPHEETEILWSGCPMHYKDPLHDGYPTHRGFCTHYEHPMHPATIQWTMATPRIAVMPNTSGISCTTDATHSVDTPHSAATSMHRGLPMSYGSPPSVTPPARGCGPSVGALWAAAPHVARAGSRIRLALTCRCVVMETGEMLMSPWQREPGNFGGDGEQADGVCGGAMGSTHSSPPPSP